MFIHKFHKGKTLVQNDKKQKSVLHQRLAISCTWLISSDKILTFPLKWLHRAKMIVSHISGKGTLEKWS